MRRSTLADTPVMDRLMKECPFATGNLQLFGVARFQSLWYALECVSKFGKMHLAGNSVAVTAS